MNDPSNYIWFNADISSLEHGRHLRMNRQTTPPDNGTDSHQLLDWRSVCHADGLDANVDFQDTGYRGACQFCIYTQNTKHRCGKASQQDDPTTLSVRAKTENVMQPPIKISDLKLFRTTS